MTRPLQKPETLLLAFAAGLLLLATFAPSLAQPANYHAFADARTYLGVPRALDVLSNLPFAFWGIAGLALLWRAPAQAVSRVQGWLAALFFVGLLTTAACSAIYHWQPHDAGLALDRSGMVLAFAGLIGLCVAGRVSERAGVVSAAAVLLLGPLSVWVWASTGNVLPWGVLQFGTMALLLALAWVPALPTALPIAWGWLILVYTVAKVLELADHQVFELTQHLVSGHTLKHVVASFAAWPVAASMWGRHRPLPLHVPAVG